ALAVRPKPCSPPLTTVAEAALPSGRTVIWTPTTHWLMSSASASGGNGQFHEELPSSPTGLERSGPGGGGGGGGAGAVPRPPGIPSFRASLRIVILSPLPSPDWTPPRAVPSPLTMVPRSTGSSLGFGSAVRTLAALEGAGLMSL